MIYIKETRVKSMEKAGVIEHFVTADKFDRIIFEQPKAGPKGGRQDAWNSRRGTEF
jgi:hypothetical protein